MVQWEQNLNAIIVCHSVQAYTDQLESKFMHNHSICGLSDWALSRISSDQSFCPLQYMIDVNGGGAGRFFNFENAQNSIKTRTNYLPNLSTENTVFSKMGQSLLLFFFSCLLTLSPTGPGGPAGHWSSATPRPGGVELCPEHGHGLLRWPWYVVKTKTNNSGLDWEIGDLLNPNTFAESSSPKEHFRKTRQRT